ncbi:MAG: molybdopterin converting factor subunit 1 [Proteobacteria bacterium]|nr:molybdopterin converting factor subunit 1 [Pseudomonadota bacterium]
MKVKVLFFASLREQLGTAAEDLDLPAGVGNVAALRSHLRGRGGAWELALADGKLVRAAVNQDMAPPTTSLKAGDEVAFFPPVTGG